MDRLINQLKSKSAKLTIAIFALLLILAVTAEVTIRDQGAYLILFSLVYVLLPGFLFIVAIDKSFLYRYREQALIISLFTGFSLLIPQYYILNAFGLLKLIRFTPLILLVLFAILSIKNLKQIKSDIHKVNLLDSLLPFITLFAITAVASYLALKSVVVKESSAIHIDYSYHMGNINILTRGGSLEDTRVMGMTFKYHYFMDLYYAILKLILPARTWNCVFRYPILLVSPIAAPSIYFFANEKFKKPILSYAASLFIVFFPSIYSWVTEFTPHVLNNFNNVGFSIPLAICLTHLMVNSTDTKQYRYTDLIIIFLLTVVLTGTKGPFALVLLGSMLIFLVYCAVVRRKVSLYQISCFIAALLAFALIWFTLLNVAINDKNVISDKQGIMRFFDYGIIMPDYTVLSEHASDPAYSFITIPLSLIECFGGAAIPFILTVPALLVLQFRKNREKINLATAFVAICACVSLGGTYLLAIGHNKIYFLMFAIPYVYLSATGFFETMKNVNNKGLKVLNGIITGITVILCGTSLVSSVLNPEQICGFDPPEPGEVNAIVWIRENTDENDLFAINDHHPDWKVYYYSGFTDRRFYLESYHYSMNSGKTEADLTDQIEKNDQMFYSSNSPAIAEELGIDYFIYYDISGEMPAVLEENYTLCYTSDCVKIYRRA